MEGGDVIAPLASLVAPNEFCRDAGKGIRSPDLVLGKSTKGGPI